MQGSRTLNRRGGVAASNLPSGTNYDALPPSSTYRGPTIAGSKGGFIGLVTGLGILLIVLLTAYFLFRRWRNRVQRSEGASGAGRGLAGGRGWARTGHAYDEGDDNGAFEMPSAFAPSTTDLEGAGGKKWLNPSTMSLDYREGQGGGGREERYEGDCSPEVQRGSGFEKEKQEETMGRG